MCVWIYAALNPLDRGTWLMENVLVLIFVPIALIAAKYFRVSKLSFALVALFFTLHVIGSHWGYADVPFGWTLGEWIGSARNTYDRLVHFSFGLLLAYPIREIFVRVTQSKGVWSFVFPLDITLSLSALFEIAEWIASVAVNGPVGIAYLGAQGDPWDTQKDMACAGVGALLTILILLVIHIRRNRGFSQEMRESLHILP